MFRPSKIYHTTVIVKEDKVNEIINRLYELGICELKESEIDMPSKYSYELVKSLDEVSNRFNFIVDSLEEYKEIMQPESRIKQIFSPQIQRKHESRLYSTEDLIEEIKYNLRLIEPRVLQRLGKLEKIREQIQKNQFIISNLSLIPDIETNVFESSENIKVLLGLIKNTSLPDIKKELMDKAVIGFKEKDKNQSFITIFSTLENAPIIEKVLHSVGFEALEVPYEDKKPKAIIGELKKEIEKLKNEERKINVLLKKSWKLYEKRFALLSEELEIAKQKILSLQNFKTTESFSVLEAWVPKQDFNKFHKTIEEISKQYYMESEEKDTAPTLLNNPKLIKPFEMLTELYSLPKYKKFDPTPILAITFTLFFGFMLTDFVYGILLAGLGWILYNGIGKIKKGLKTFGTLLIVFGISATIMGVVFGSYFGNFFQELGINLPVPIDSMKQVMLMLSIALTIGFVHLITGLGVGFYENFKDGNIREALKRQGVWIIFMIGLLLFLFKLNTFALIAIFISLVLQLSLNFLEGGIITSLLSLFGFTGFVGDLFSYARLMALAIGTSGIALAVNFMVFMIIGLIPWLGWPIAIIIFIIGHLFNLAMNGLGAFVHSTRLHFLEFFTKFYDGGGRNYKPFVAERVNTYVKLEGGK